MVKQPFRVATSRTAQKTYLNSILFVSGSLVLLVLAVVAYVVFYFSYVPQKLHSITVHLQYNDGINPYGVASVSPSLMYEQAYDITVELSLPQSPSNIDRGNFMVILYALRTEAINPAQAFSLPYHPYDSLLENRDDIVFASKRPTLIPYVDPVVSCASRILFLLYHIFSPKSESATLRIPMAEKAELGHSVHSLYLELQAGQTLQVYSATITLVARLSGLRWAMYNHRVASFFLFTAVFWLFEIVSMVLAWLIMSSYTRAASKNATQPTKPEKPEKAGVVATSAGIKMEEVETEDLSETSRTFPTYGRQAPLRYDPKAEEDYGHHEITEIPRHAGEADDEEDQGEPAASKGLRSRDSGLGTSYSDATVGSVRRRSSKGKLSS